MTTDEQCAAIARSAAIVSMDSNFTLDQREAAILAAAARIEQLSEDAEMLDWLGDQLSGSKWADQGATISAMRPESIPPPEFRELLLSIARSPANIL